VGSQVVRKSHETGLMWEVLTIWLPTLPTLPPGGLLALVRECVSPPLEAYNCPEPAIISEHRFKSPLCEEHSKSLTGTTCRRVRLARRNPSACRRCVAVWHRRNEAR
jgi:hypothetical protein